MKLRALVSFSGAISVSKGREFEATKAVAEDLIAAGYAELVAKSGNGGDKGKGGNAPTPPQTPPQGDKKTEEEDKAPAASTNKDNKSGAEKDK